MKVQGKAIVCDCGNEELVIIKLKPKKWQKVAILFCRKCGREASIEVDFDTLQDVDVDKIIQDVVAGAFGFNSIPRLEAVDDPR